MCGICGFTGFEDNQILKEMMDTIVHRGPDDSGMYSDPHVSLGHRRLSIIDLSSKGRQPLSNEDNTIWITFNGEIYNYASIKNGLIANHTFYSNTDTEVMIHSYEEKGIAFLDELIGMFAFALYDSVKNKLYLVRDNIGQKPLYYYIDSERLFFASEIKSILAALDHLNVKRKLNKSALYSYLRNQYVPGSETMFENIYKLLPGYYLEYDLLSKTYFLKQYWTFNENLTGKSEEYYSENLQKLLDDSTKMQMVADVPIGAFLSGGIDSSAVVAFAKKHTSSDLHTFSMGFGEYFSELSYAKIASDYLDTVHHEIIVEAGDILKSIPKVAWHYDEPIGDAAVFANYFLSETAKKYVKVALAGEGADELFGGYGSYSTGMKFHTYYRLPAIFRDIFRRIISMTPSSGNPVRNYRRVYAGYLAQKDLVSAQQYAWRISSMTDDELLWFLNRNESLSSTEFVPTARMNDPLNRILASDCKNHLPELYLMKADKGMMANSIEERLPILDKRIIELAFTMPGNLKIGNNTEKYIWKKATRNNLPKEIVERKKQGFGVPYAEWLSWELKEYAENVICDGYFTNNFFNKKKIEYLLNADHSNKRIGMIVWNLFMLESWNNVYKVTY